MDSDLTLGKILGWVFGAFVVVVVITALGAATGILTRPLRTASGLAERTFDSGNVQRTYELFHDRQRGYESRLMQIAATTKQLAEEPDPIERTRMRIELNAQRQSCRDIASGYNSDATKTNRSIFMGTSLPQLLSVEAC